MSTGGTISRSSGRPSGSPALIVAAAVVQSRRSPASPVRSVSVEVERAEDEPILRGGGDPGLMGAVERDRIVGRRAVVVAGEDVAAGTRCGEADRAAAGRGEEAPA